VGTVEEMVVPPVGLCTVSRCRRPADWMLPPTRSTRAVED
jgi:hypothetical protein